MGARAAAYVPFVLAVLFPPVGLLLAAVAAQRDRGEGLRLLIISLLAAVVWVALFIV